MKKYTLLALSIAVLATAAGCNKEEPLSKDGNKSPRTRKKSSAGTPTFPETWLRNTHAMMMAAEKIKKKTMGKLV